MRIVLLACLVATAQGSVWPPSTAALFARDGATCDITVRQAPGARPVWEGRVVAKGARVRVMNRRASSAIPPGPEELLWTGKGALRIMGGRVREFLPGPTLTMAELYLALDFLVPLWEPTGAAQGKTPVQGPFGSGTLTLSREGRPESLHVASLTRPLWNQATSFRVAFSHRGDSSPWATATVFGPDGRSLVVVERLRWRREKVADEVVSPEQEKGLRLADLSRPLGQLAGSEGGVYAETAGASAAFKGAQEVSSGEGGALYMGPVPNEEEVDRFLREGGLGRYSQEEVR